MSRVLPPVTIEGVAFWASRLPGWELARAVMRGERMAPAQPAPRPAPTLLAPTERRRASETVALALEVAARACASAGRASSTLPSVFASTHGDLQISDYMCATLARTPTLISPTRFHNSVHNAASGYWSIGTGNHAPCTAISACRHTFGTGLLEAATQVACTGGAVLYVAFDIEARGPLATVAPSRGLLGCALVIGPTLQTLCPDASPGAQNGPARDLRPGRCMTICVESCVPDVTPPRSRAAELVAENVLAPCLPLFEALAGEEAAALTLALGTHAALSVRIEAEAGAAV